MEIELPGVVGCDSCITPLAQFNDKSIVFVLIALTVVAAGCANLNYASPVDAAASADRSKAYLYGRFRLFEGSDTAMRLSIELRNLDED